MANRLFEHFPENANCPICGKSDDRPCFLLPIDGTTEERICEAAPTHADCITEHLAKFQYNDKVGIIYIVVEELCQKCGKPSEGLHSCPYASEINDDPEYCNCCMDNCRADI